MISMSGADSVGGVVVEIFPVAARGEDRSNDLNSGHFLH